MLNAPRAGEQTTFYVRPDYGFGGQGSAELGVPPEAELIYDVELLDFQKGKDTWDMNVDEKLARGNQRKELGNRLFKAQNFKGAERYYEKVLDLFRYDNESDEAKKKSIEALKVRLSGRRSHAPTHLLGSAGVPHQLGGL